MRLPYTVEPTVYLSIALILQGSIQKCLDKIGSGSEAVLTPAAFGEAYHLLRQPHKYSRLAWRHGYQVGLFFEDVGWLKPKTWKPTTFPLRIARRLEQGLPITESQVKEISRVSMEACTAYQRAKRLW